MNTLLYDFQSLFSYFFLIFIIYKQFYCFFFCFHFIVANVANFILVFFLSLQVHRWTTWNYFLFSKCVQTFNNVFKLLVWTNNVDLPGSQCVLLSLRLMILYLRFNLVFVNIQWIKEKLWTVVVEVMKSNFKINISLIFWTVGEPGENMLTPQRGSRPTTLLRRQRNYCTALVTPLDGTTKPTYMNSWWLSDKGKITWDKKKNHPYKDVQSCYQGQPRLNGFA